MALFRGLGARKDASRGTVPLEVRKVLAGLFASTGGPGGNIGARSGILYQGRTTPLVTGDATWAYNVDLFHAYVSRSASDGGQVYGNDGSVLIGATGVGSTVPIAPGAGLQRIDIAWTRHPTNTENADTASEPLFGVESGAAAASNPVAPSIPAGAFEVGRNLMTSAATSTLSAGNTITQSALFTALRGAPVPVRNQTERDALTAYDGLQVYRLDLHCVETYNGTSWGAWIAYTPAQTGISLGNGTLTGFSQLTGKTLDLNINFTFGSTTTWGTGDILIGLPSGMTGLRGQALPAIMFDASSGFDYLGMGKLASAGAMIAVGLNGGFVASINGARPFAWAVGDTLTISGRIEIV